MASIDERVILGLRVRIDRDLCVGFGDCIEEAGEVFELDAEQIAVFLDTADQVERKRLLKACAACPVDAISVHDMDGEPVETS